MGQNGSLESPRCYADVRRPVLSVQKAVHVVDMDTYTTHCRFFCVTSIDRNNPDEACLDTNAVQVVVELLSVDVFRNTPEGEVSTRWTTRAKQVEFTFIIIQYFGTSYDAMSYLLQDSRLEDCGLQCSRCNCSEGFSSFTTYQPRWR